MAGTDLLTPLNTSTGWVFNYDWIPVDKQQKIDTYNALWLMYAYAKLSNAQRILELGVGKFGISTWLLLKVCDETGGRLTSVDINPSCGNFYSGNKEWTFVAGDSLYVDINGSYDIVMIDTSHTYEQTKGELEKYVPMLRKNGLLYMHDTNLSPVMDAFNEYQNKENNLRFLSIDGKGPDEAELRVYKKIK